MRRAGGAAALAGVVTWAAVGEEHVVAGLLRVRPRLAQEGVAGEQGGARGATFVGALGSESHLLGLTQRHWSHLSWGWLQALERIALMWDPSGAASCHGGTCTVGV